MPLFVQAEGRGRLAPSDRKLTELLHQLAFDISDVAGMPGRGVITHRDIRELSDLMIVTQALCEALEHETLASYVHEWTIFARLRVRQIAAE